MQPQTLLCSIAKNESPYLIEWIAYHKFIVGFDQIIIYENDSRDESLSLLKKLEEIGLCKCQEWHRVTGQAPQQSAYNHVITTQRDLFQWVCFLDLDEFLVLKSFRSIHDCVNSFEQVADSILINWLMFGSSGYNDYLPELVIKRFVKCAASYSQIHKHMKSISKISAIESVDIHIPLLKPGSKYFHIDGTELKFDKNPTGEHIGEKSHVNHEPAQINHYQSKSLEEYKCRRLKGRATVDNRSPQSHLKPGDFERLNSYTNELENHDILARISELENHIFNIYTALGGRQEYDEKFAKFIKSEAQRYDHLYTQPSVTPTKPQQNKPEDNLPQKNNPRENQRFWYYKNILTNLVDVKTKPGLEIGAFDRPFITPNQGIMHYADYRTTQELKEVAQRASGHHPNFVVEVTYNLTQISLSEIQRKYDYIIASHVIEHTPNMIGFLNEISNLLTETGFAFLIIPDKRYTFDCLKPVTSLGELLENHFNQLNKPAFRQVFNSYYYSRPLNTSDVWAGKVDSQSLSRIPRNLNQLISKAEKSKEVYIDSHCNIFTDFHFYDIISELVNGNLLNFSGAEVYQVKPGFMDFLCILRRQENQNPDLYSLFPDLKDRLIRSNSQLKSQPVDSSNFKVEFQQNNKSNQFQSLVEKVRVEIESIRDRLDPIKKTMEPMKVQKNIDKKTSIQSVKPPLIADGAIDFLKDFLTRKPNARILEFGSGGSTIWFSTYTSNLVSIEHDKGWYDKVKSELDSSSACNSVNLKFLSKPYYSVCDEFPDEYFDLILVDGRNRVRCAENSIRVLKKGGILMLDDAQRPYYHRVHHLLQDWEHTRTIHPARQTHWWVKPKSFKLFELEWEKALQKTSVRLYGGSLSEQAKKDGWIGLAFNQSDPQHIKQDLTKPFPIPNNVVDCFQFEDIFQRIEPSELLKVTFPEIYRVMKPGGFIRISVPDYRCDCLIARCWKDENGKPYYDPQGGGKWDAHRQKVTPGGHIWLPNSEKLQTLIDLSPLRNCKAHWLHYYDTNGQAVMNEIDYSKGYVMRTPDHDGRVQNPRRPLSIVVDLYK